MPNRIIKESICTSEEIDGLSPEAEILFYRLMVKADDFGLYFANPKIISGTCFPLKQPKEAAVAGWMRELVAAGLIFVYTADSKDYLKLASWEKHQQTRAQKSKFPLPISSDSKCNQAQSNVPVIVNDNVIVNENDNDICAPAGAPDEPTQTKKEIDALFDEVWGAYPLKRGKGKISDAAKKRIAKVGREHMLRCINRLKGDMKAMDRPIGKYPYGSTFFNSGYIDYMDNEYKPVRASPYRKKLDDLKYDQRPPGEDGLDRDFDDISSQIERDA